MKKDPENYQLKKMKKKQKLAKLTHINYFPQDNDDKRILKPNE